MIEVELKFRIAESELKNIENRLSDLGYAKSEPKNQVDTVYLEAKNKDFSTFTPGEPVARVRKDGESITMTVKRKMSDGVSLEHETICDSFSAACGIFEALLMNKVVEVNKTRTEFKKDSYTVTLDNVLGLGWFVEIETLAEEGVDTSSLESNILNIAEELGISKDSTETKKYDVLLMAK